MMARQQLGLIGNRQPNDMGTSERQQEEAVTMG